MRKTKVKKWIAMGLTATMIAGVLGGCGNKKTTESSTAAKSESQTAATTVSDKPDLKGEVEIVTNANQDTFNAVNQIFQKFMEENPGVKINYSTQESDYEQLMKARMASNDMPDIFTTHGWSVARYSEYLRPLNDQPWFNTIEPTFLPNIQNEKADIFVLPINMDQGGLLYNKGLLKELGVEIPKTWDEFMNICEKGKIKGYTGVFLAGKDSRQPANLLDIAATTYLASCEDKNYTAQLADGSFDWKNWTPLSQMLTDLKTKGYLNIDCVTCDPIDIVPRLAENTTLFMLSSDPATIQQVQDINPAVEFGLAPIPALDSTYEPAFCGGEREAYGIWKDTKKEDICFAILSYLSKPEHVKLICEASGKRSAIANVNPELGSVAADYATYSDVKVYPFFDRVYLPNGMWSTLKTIGSALLAEEITVDESVKTMETDYDTLRLQN